MTVFDRFIVVIAVVAAGLASAGVANAAVVLMATGALQTYPELGRNYTVKFDFDASKPSHLVYMEYFGAVNPEDFVAEYQVGPYSGPGSYSPPATFGGKINLTYELVAQAPEPAPWAMMLVGFSAIGLGIRTGRENQTAQGVRTAPQPAHP